MTITTDRRRAGPTSSEDTLLSDIKEALGHYIRREEAAHRDGTESPSLAYTNAMSSSVSVIGYALGMAVGFACRAVDEEEFQKDMGMTFSDKMRELALANAALGEKDIRDETARVAALLDALMGVVGAKALDTLDVASMTDDDIGALIDRLSKGGKYDA